VKLYSYFRSSAAYRVRIALNLKGVACEMVAIHLTRDGGRHKSAEYRAINPQMRVPALVLDDGAVLVQSLAIIDYLDETFRDPPLLPSDPVARAHARGIAEIVACDIHPINNLVTLNYLRAPLGHDQAAIDAWYAHWIMTGFEAIEAMIAPGRFAVGASPTVADLCIVPQVFNARRYKLPLERFPNILGVEAACLALPAFDRARPENQPDAE
jgi:maleylacetoacetate isomerase